MAKVIIYTTKICPYCVMAKQLLAKKQIQYQEILLDEQPHLRDEMLNLSGRKTVPQIFINDRAVGGYDDLYALERAGELDKLLN